MGRTWLLRVWVPMMGLCILCLSAGVHFYNQQPDGILGLSFTMAALGLFILLFEHM